MRRGGDSMVIKQLSVFLENSPGRLKAATQVLADSKINMRALTLADTADFGVLRIIVDKPGDAVDILKKNHFAVKITEVLAVEMEDTPGGLNKVLEILENNQVNIEYMYAFMGSKPRKALVIFRVDQLEKAIECLRLEEVRLISTEKEVEELIHFCWE